jgi:hypothetical protein
VAASFNAASGTAVAPICEIDQGLGAEMRNGHQLRSAIAAHPTLAYLAIAHTPLGWKAFQDFTRGAVPLPELISRWPIATSIKTAKMASQLVRRGSSRSPWILAHHLPAQSMFEKERRATRRS